MEARLSCGSLKYALSYHEAPNALDPEVERARKEREAGSLAGYRKTAARVATLAQMHKFLFEEHMAYATPRLLKVGWWGQCSAAWEPV